MADDDHARAKAAREAGQIVSLEAILDRVQAEFIGSPVEV
ncbi:MAG: peptidase, partial [Candidatus Rokuibacteriota bacterium]